MIKRVKMFFLYFHVHVPKKVKKSINRESADVGITRSGIWVVALRYAAQRGVTLIFASISANSQPYSNIILPLNPWPKWECWSKNPRADNLVRMSLLKAISNQIKCFIFPTARIHYTYLIIKKAHKMIHHQCW
jgi:hypothetical protein